MKRLFPALLSLVLIVTTIILIASSCNSSKTDEIKTKFVVAVVFTNGDKDTVTHEVGGNAAFVKLYDGDACISLVGESDDEWKIIVGNVRKYTIISQAKIVTPVK